MALRPWYILILTLLLFLPQKAFPQLPFGGEVRTEPLLRLERPKKEVFDSLLKEAKGLSPEIRDPLGAMALYLLMGEGRDRDLLKGIEGTIRDLPEDLDGLLSKAILSSILYRYDRGGRWDGIARDSIRRIEDLYYDRKQGLIDRGGLYRADDNAIFLSALFILPDDLEGMGKRGLNLFQKAFLGNDGVATFYLKGKGPRGDGELRANLSAALLFYIAYKRLGEEALKEKASNIVDFMVGRLYDPLFGGFILKNSKTPYPPEGSPFVEEKPFLENALTAYLLFKLKGDGEEYLATINHLLKEKEGRAYGESIALLTAYMVGIERPVTRTPLEGQGVIVLTILSFIAGLLSFLSPCTLPILPAYFAYTFQSDRKRIFLMTFAFFLGLALLFSLMGATATFVGSLLRSHYGLLLKIGGGIITLMGTLSLIGKGFSGYQFQGRPAATFLGSFIFGCSIAIGWTACVGPILAGILVLASTQEWASIGAFLLFIYALGLGLPLMVLSLFFHRLGKDSLFWRIIRGKGWDITVGRVHLHLHSNNIIAGLLFITLGVLMMEGYLTYLNRALPLEIQVWFADAEEWLLELLG